MNTKIALETLSAGTYDRYFSVLYGEEAVEPQRRRWADAVREFVKLYGEAEEVFLFSAPGRTEIGGNHTDHNHGCVLAGSVDLDVIAVVAKNSEPLIRVKSAGYDMDTVNIGDLEVKENEKNRSVSLVRGTAACFESRGYAIGGFHAYTTSNVLKGSGLSSSAAFEVLIGTILSHLYNNGTVSAVEIAQIAQYAENHHFGKPCGLMDQMASSVGGIISIDFADTEHPVIRSVPFDFVSAGHRLCIVDTAGSHANLTDEYAAVPAEMHAVAQALGVNYLRETTFEALLPRLPDLRRRLGDRAVLRALHFFAENDRVIQQVNALQNNEFDRFLQLITASGHSSFEFLQNVYPSSAVKFQGLSVALALAQRILNGRGACRVHGGGFAGTTQNFVPEDLVPLFRDTMEEVFGTGSCHTLMIRPFGGIRLTKDGILHG